MTNSYRQQIAEFDFIIDEKNGCFVGQDGCHYDTKAEAMYYGQLDLCGCGRPEDIHKLLIKILEARDDAYPNHIDYNKIQSLISENVETVAEFVLHFLDSKRLLEHGGSVYGCWITDRGKQFIDIGPMEE